jgi:hypothetical protein
LFFLVFVFLFFCFLLFFKYFFWVGFFIFYFQNCFKTKTKKEKKAKNEALKKKPKNQMNVSTSLNNQNNEIALTINATDSWSHYDYTIKQQIACSKQQTCTNCTRYNFCHWCSFDSKCHVFGSPYGCAVGLDCNDRSLCFRDTPEYVGPVVLTEVVGYTSLSGVVTLLCFLFCLVHCRIKKIRRHAEMIELYENDINNGYDRLGFSDPVLRRIRYGSTPLPEPIVNQLTKKQSCCSPALCLSIVLVVGIVTLSMAFIILYWPQIPVHSTCTSHLEWSSIIDTIKTHQPTTLVELHLSIYNPNRVSFLVRTASLTAFFHGDTIGSGTMEKNILFHGGTITDVIAEITFSMSASVAYEVWQEHQAHELMLDFFLQLSGDVYYAEQRLLNINTTWNIPNMDMSKPRSRAYCKC